MNTNSMCFLKDMKKTYLDICFYLELSKPCHKHYTIRRKRENINYKTLVLFDRPMHRKGLVEIMSKLKIATV